MNQQGFNVTNYVKKFSKDKVIFNEGSKGREMYVIIKGKIQISQLVNNQAHVLSIMEEGTFFGEMSTIRGVPRVATATAESDVELLVVSPSTFRDLLQTKPGFGIKVIKELCNRLEDSNKRIEKLALLNQIERVVRLLMNLVTDHGQKAFKPMKLDYGNVIKEIVKDTRNDTEMAGKILATLAKYKRINVVEQGDARYVDISGELLKND